jgi:hypothetical protein
MLTPTCNHTCEQEKHPVELPALGADAAKIRQQARQQEQAPDEPVAAITAFLVYLTPEGRYLMEADLDRPLTTERPPTRGDITAGCQNVLDDARRQAQTEEITMNVLGNFSRMMSDPNYHAMVEQARTQAAVAMGAANSAATGR